LYRRFWLKHVSAEKNILIWVAIKHGRIQKELVEIRSLKEKKTEYKVRNLRRVVRLLGPTNVSALIKAQAQQRPVLFFPGVLQ
jgi:hypothetical protein